MATDPQTGIRNADEIIRIARAYGLTVTVETTDHDGFTTHKVRIAIPVPAAYAGTERGRAIAGDTLTMQWTKSSRKGSRGRMEDATDSSATGHRKLRTLSLVTARVGNMGREAQKYARDAAPRPDDVIDAPHALYLDGKLRREGIPADRVRTIINNRRFAGRPVHQDDDGAIICDTRRYVPVTAKENAGAPTEERQHVRIVNGGAPVLISSRDALAEINDAMMGPGKRAVREMSEGQGNARIVYRDPARGTVELRAVRTASTPAVQDRRPTVQELTGPVDDALLAHFAETYAAVADGTAIPVRADMVRPGMDVIAAVRLEDRTVGTVKAYNGPGAPWVRVTWESRSHADSVMGDARVFEPDHHLMVTVESLERLYGAAQTAPAAPAEDVTPLFAALAAHEAATYATLGHARDVDDLARHLLALGKVAPTEHHLEVVEAQADVEEAAEALRTARGLMGRNDAHQKARAAVKRARTAILAIAPRANRMHGTDLPATADTIRAAALAYNAVNSTPEELAAIESGTPRVRVHCRSDSGTGRTVKATITAGLDSHTGYIPAHPPLVVTFRKRDGRADAAANARRVLGSRFRVDVPVEYVTDPRP